ncbi:MAG TPA: hypothetical protein VIL97_01150, partial [Thermoanaerobaculia bacterium]
PIFYIRGTATSSYSVSQRGSLIYATGAAKSRLAWFDRNGRELGGHGEPASFGTLRLSPDDKRLLVDVEDASGNTDLWIYETGREAATRFTFKPAIELAGSWSPDGSEIAYAIEAKRPAFDFAVKSARGSGLEKMIWSEPDTQKIPMDWSPDGKSLLMIVHNPKGQVLWDIWLYSLVDRKARPLIQSRFTEFSASFSPDGKWFVYSSNESGKYEVYAQPVGGGGKWQISTNGGSFCTWSRAGNEIFYLGYDNKMMSAPVKIGETLEVGDPQVLFQARPAPVQGRVYDVSRDAQRFAMNITTEDSASLPLTLVMNWPAMFEPEN